MALTVDQVKTFLGKFIDLNSVGNKTEIKKAITDAIAAHTDKSTLDSELTGLGGIDAIVPHAENIFQAEIIDDTIKNKIEKELDKQHEFDLTKPNSTEVTLRGLKGVKITSGSGVSIDKEDGDTLVLKIDPKTYKDGDKITLSGNYKGEPVKLTNVSFKAKDISVSAPLDKDGKAVVEYPANLTDAQVTTLGSGDFEAKRVSGSQNKVEVSLKDGKTGTELPAIDLTINGRDVKGVKASVTKAADAAKTEEEGGFMGHLGDYWKYYTGGLAAIVGLFVSSRNASEDGSSYLGPVLGIVGGFLAAWGIWGGGTEEDAKAKPATN